MLPKPFFSISVVTQSVKTYRERCKQHIDTFFKVWLSHSSHSATHKYVHIIIFYSVFVLIRDYPIAHILQHTNMYLHIIIFYSVFYIHFHCLKTESFLKIIFYMSFLFNLILYCRKFSSSKWNILSTCHLMNPSAAFINKKIHLHLLQVNVLFWLYC